MGVTWSQMFPPAPNYTEVGLPSQKGKVFIVTGGYSGVGYHLSSILYNAGGKVYIAGRSEAKAKSAIQEITSAINPASAKDGQSSELTGVDQRGSVHFLQLDLSDLSTIKKSAAEFAAQESQLNVLFNNAGVSQPPLGSRSKQDHELQMGTNCLGPFLFTKLLHPQLRKAAESNDDGPDQGSPVRVVWTSSQIVELSAPTGGLDFTDLTNIPSDQTRNYANSKTGNYFLAAEFARRVGNELNILSVTTNPGALKTDLLRYTSAFFRLMVSPLLHPAVKGAYTNLFAGLSTDLSVRNGNGGEYIIPWGRLHPGMRKDLLMALAPEGEDGGTGAASRFWEWCEEQVKAYM